MAKTFGREIVMVEYWPGPLVAGPESVGSLPPFQPAKDGTVTPPEFDVQSDQLDRHPMNVKPEPRTGPPLPPVQVPLSKVKLLKVKALLSERKLFRSVVSCPRGR